MWWKKKTTMIVPARLSHLPVELLMFNESVPSSSLNFWRRSHRIYSSYVFFNFVKKLFKLKPLSQDSYVCIFVSLSKQENSSSTQLSKLWTAKERKITAIRCSMTKFVSNLNCISVSRCHFDAWLIMQNVFFLRQCLPKNIDMTKFFPLILLLFQQLFILFFVSSTSCDAIASHIRRKINESK